MMWGAKEDDANSGFDYVGIPGCFIFRTTQRILDYNTA